MADKWLAPDTCGVKLAEFDRMTRDLTRAGPELAALADQLWQALHSAGVGTTPAMEIKRLAAWADRAATDLRRRNALAHALDREKITMTACRPDGTYLVLPDRYTDQVGYAEGRRMADLLRRASEGDRKALSDLRRHDPANMTPAMAKALVETLGAQNLLKLTGSLSFQVGAHRDDKALATDTRAALTHMGRALALSTNPSRSNGYAGDPFLRDLIQAGRANFPPATKPPNGMAGYQALSTLLAAAGDARFSPKFLQTVGTDMLAYDHGLRKHLDNKPLPDRAGSLRLGNTITPKQADDFLIPLLERAAASGKEGAQALLKGGPMGPHVDNIPAHPRMGNLKYLLSERREVWNATDKGAALGQALRVAASGQDNLSRALAFDAGKILADDARKFFVVKERKLGIENEERMDALSNLRVPMAEVMGSHITTIADVHRLFRYTTQTGSTGMRGDDLDYLFLELTRSTDGFKALLKAQSAYAKVAIDRAAGDKEALQNVLIGQATMFGHILEARQQSVGGTEAAYAENLKQTQETFDLVVGFAFSQPVDAVSQRAPIAGDVLSAGVSKAQTALTSWLAKQTTDRPNPNLVGPTDGPEAVKRLLNQMSIASMATRGLFSEAELRGRSFATQDPHPKLIPPNEMNASQLEDFTTWLDAKSPLTDQEDRTKGAVENGMRETAGHYKGIDGKNVFPSQNQ